MREPMLRLSALLRAFGDTSDSGQLPRSATPTRRHAGQTAMRSPTVFNFYRPGYVPPGTQAAAASLVAPEMPLAHETSAASYVNYMRQRRDGVGTRRRDGQRCVGLRSDLQPDFSAELAQAASPADLVEQLSTKLMYGSMPDALKTEIRTAVESIIDPDAEQRGQQPGGDRHRQAQPGQRRRLPDGGVTRVPGSEVSRDSTTMKKLDASRRMFLRHAGVMSTLGAAGGPLALNLAALGTASAQAAADYKAIVCIFLFGGNDSINMVLPTDTASFTNYTTLRSQAPDSIALLAAGHGRAAATAALADAHWAACCRSRRPNAQGRSFALHPTMGSLQTMFDTDKRLAILPNVGPLILPTTKAQYSQASHRKPASLFSHNDQQNTWQAFLPEGATVGWGGRMGDLLASMNSRTVFTSITAGGNAVWLSGNDVRQYQVTSNGAIRLGTNAAGQVYGSPRWARMERIVQTTRGGHLLETDLSAVAARSMQAESLLRNALKPASDPLFGTAPASGSYNANFDPKLQYTDPSDMATLRVNSLAQQLQIVARMIDASSSASIGAKRQVFFVSMGGFDTHDAQNTNHALLMARLSHALRYFDDALGAMGARERVTTFTASDFGRTFTSNGDGTDHGWGAHHFVSGGAVRGGDLYGSFPIYGAKNANNNNFDSSPDQLGNGSLLPTTSVDQLGATLGKWFGLSDTQLLDVFPNLSNFSTRDLGFMNPA